MLAANAAAIQQLRDVTGSISSDLTSAAEYVEPREPKSPMATSSSKQGENGQPAVAIAGTDDEKRVAKIQNDVHSAFKRRGCARREAPEALSPVWAECVDLFFKQVAVAKLRL